jgi:endonuclease-3
MTIKERYRLTIDYFLKYNPQAETELIYREPFELIVAVILSAQCTDKRVNMITPELLKKFPDARSMSKASQEEIFELIRSCSYPNNKAKHLCGMSKMLVKEFGGIVPSDTALLQKLPGVGRKTANVIASVIFNKPVMAVDTHVFRVANRIGLVKNAKTPLSVELQLSENIPDDLMHKAHHWLILHGRYVCKARNPLCEKCGLTGFCKHYSGLRGIKENKKGKQIYKD